MRDIFAYALNPFPVPSSGGPTSTLPIGASIHLLLPPAVRHASPPGKTNPPFAKTHHADLTSRRPPWRCNGSQHNSTTDSRPPLSVCVARVPRPGFLLRSWLWHTTPAIRLLRLVDSAEWSARGICHIHSHGPAAPPFLPPLTMLACRETRRVRGHAYPATSVPTTRTRRWRCLFGRAGRAAVSSVSASHLRLRSREYVAR